jgi:hypothetical protein
LIKEKKEQVRIYLEICASAGNNIAARNVLSTANNHTEIHVYFEKEGLANAEV